MAECVDCHVQLGAALALGTVIPGPRPTLGLERRVRLSILAAVGSSLRPAASLNTARKSCAKISNTPAANHRCDC